MPETGNNTPVKDISIRISTDGFSFAAGSAARSLEFEKSDDEYLRTMAICLCESELQDASPRRIAIDSACFSLVPESLFSPERAAALLGFGCALPPESRIFATPIAGHGIVNVFAIDRGLYDFVRGRFGGASISHAQTPFIRRALRESRREEQTQAWINASRRSACMLLVRDGRLLFANRFALSSADDLLYYAGSLYSRHGLSQQNCPAYASGPESYIDALRERIAKVHPFKLPL